MEHRDLPYRFQDGRLLVPSELWEDENVMRNVTAAAMNWYWLVFYAGYEGDRRATWEDASALRVEQQMESFQERDRGAPSP